MERPVDCSMQFFYISAILILSILGLALGRKILKKAPRFSKFLKELTLPRNPMTINLHQEVAELRRATLQVARDWMDMTDMMTTMKDQQLAFIRRLDLEFEDMSGDLQSSVRRSLEEECTRNNQRFNKMHGMIEGFTDEILSIKGMIENQGELIKQTRERPVARVDGWSQTERDVALKKRTREVPTKPSDEVAVDNEAARSIITVIKKALAEFLREVKKHLSLQRDDGLSDMRVIFSQLSEDKEEVKRQIESAFLTATHQTQKSFEQFGLVGHEAMKCMQALNEKSDNSLTDRFQEFGDKIAGVFDLLKGLNFDVSSIKQVLDNIDGQFDEIYQKLELSCQKNTDHCEEVTDRLQKTAEEWCDKSSTLEQISKHLGNTTDGIKDMLCSLNDLISRKMVNPMGELVQQHPPNSLKFNNDLSLFLDTVPTNQCIAGIEQLSVPEGFSTLVGMMQKCFGKLSSMKDQIEQGTDGIRQSADILVEKMDFFTKRVEDIFENLKNMNAQETDGNLNSPHKSLNRDLKEFVSNIIDLDLDSKIEEKMKLGSPRKQIGIPVENPAAALGPRLNRVRKSSGFYRKRLESDKTSIVSVVANEAPEEKARRTK